MNSQEIEYSPEEIKDGIAALIVESYVRLPDEPELALLISNLNEFFHEAVDLSNPLEIQELLLDIVHAPLSLQRAFLLQLPNFLAEMQRLVNDPVSQGESFPTEIPPLAVPAMQEVSSIPSSN